MGRRLVTTSGGGHVVSLPLTDLVCQRKPAPPFAFFGNKRSDDEVTQVNTVCRIGEYKMFNFYDVVNFRSTLLMSGMLPL